MQPLGRPVVPDVYSNAHSLSSVGAVSPSGAAKGAAGGASSGPITRKGRPARAAAASRSACRSGKATASAISEWPEKRRAVLQQQAGAVAVAIAGAGISGAQRLDGVCGAGVGQFAGFDAIGGCRFRQDAQEGLGAVARRGVAESLVDGRVHKPLLHEQLDVAERGVAPA
ncbi:hypothetical protein G6F57_019258 [Rhizopus arrhizus]|nr:hypothetical protein G6F57_019258 [Rhizopus arrhizus]